MTEMNPILVIDDEQPILNILSRSLARKGYIVDAVESGEKGIEKIDMNQYSLIFTDLLMPGLSGAEVLQHLREIRDNKTPIIGMSGTPWLLKESDFDAVLEKPFSIKDLLKVAHKFIA
ncbi:MAG: response regulator [Desulfobacteraceae bacterium]|nr:response regulator [Desulfobacteraceae bacterium]